MNIKKILSGLALGVAVCGCMGGSFSSNFVTLCNFEYSNVGASPWVDSVMFAQECAMSATHILRKFLQAFTK